MTRVLSILDQLALTRASAVRVAVAFLLLLVVPATAANAQTRPQPVPVALNNVKLISESADENGFAAVTTRSPVPMHAPAARSHTTQTRKLDRCPTSGEPPGRAVSVGRHGLLVVRQDDDL